MRDRLDKARRIERLQADLHRLAEWRHAQLVSRRGDLAVQQETLLATLNEDVSLHGLFVASMARRLKALAGETERLQAQIDAQADRVLDQAKRLKRAEKLAARVEDEHRRAAEKHDLISLIEAATARRRDASLP
jgi:hypothetical protein